MLLSHALAILTAEGHQNAKRHVIYRAIEAGHISEPRKLNNNLYWLTDENLNELRRYLPVSRFRGAKKRAVKENLASRRELSAR